jgi:hypothetical protein
MHYMSLNKFSDFILVVNSTRKHSTKNEYFPMPILFTTIYLMPEQKLNYINDSGYDINMGNFVQAIEHDFHMYTKFGGLTCYVFL